MMQQRIMYYSTNRNLNRPGKPAFTDRISFRDALFMGQAPDGGLFMPSRIPRLTRREMRNLRGLPYHETAFEVLRKFLDQEIETDVLREITKDAYDFEVPIERLDLFTYLVRLDRGPTASFKDFAARFMARAMKVLKLPRKKTTVLVATSGDTGSAVGEAFRSLSGIKVFILYPEKEVSPIQKKQLDSIGKNVQAIAVKGKFDDCQRLVKTAFSDPALKSLNLTSANSINIGRILPQIVYYFYAWANTVDSEKSVIFAIPSGNFGNSLGCEIARRMGLPVKRMLIAVNENDEFPRFLESGTYRAVNPARACLSNAMNVGHPSNLARYFDLYGGTLDKEGKVHRRPDIKAMRRNLYSVSISDEETLRTMVRLHCEYNFIVEPHGAVGLAALERYFKSHDRLPALCIETAHPGKFPEIVKKALGYLPAAPPALRKLEKRKGTADRLKNDYASFKNYLLRSC